MNSRLAALARKPYVVVMALVFAGSLAAGVLLLPGSTERIAMLERDGRGRAALELLEKRYAEGDRSQRTVYQLQHYYEQFGDLAKARQLLELLAEQRPRDAQVQRRLGLFYKQTQDEDAYMRVLRSQLATRYSEPFCRELIGLLRVRGEHEEEQRTIQSCRQGGYRRADDIVRLAGLVAADGDLVQASVLLRSVDDLRRLKGLSERLMLFTALMENEQPHEAQRRAIRWVRGQRDDFLALTLIEMLADDKRHDLAIELAKSVSVPGDGVSLAIAEVMLDRGQHLAARSYLRGWFEKARLADVQVARRFISAALDTDDADLAWGAARRFGLKRLAQADLVEVAEALAASGRTQDLDVVRAELTPATLAENPLLGAAIGMTQGAPETTRKLLTEVNVDELDEWRLALWTRLMEQTGRPAAAANVLREAGIDPQTVASVAALRTAPAAGAPREATRPAAVTAKAIRRPPKQRRIRQRPLTGGGVAAKQQAPAGGTIAPGADPFSGLFKGGG